MDQFLNWFNAPDEFDLVVKAGMAHFWFITIHPFEDGNGRIARAIADMVRARADGSPHRFYSMPSQIETERREYYLALERQQRSTTDITRWLLWLTITPPPCVFSIDDYKRKTFNHFWLNLIFLNLDLDLKGLKTHPNFEVLHQLGLIAASIRFILSGVLIYEKVLMLRPGSEHATKVERLRPSQMAPGKNIQIRSGQEGDRNRITAFASKGKTLRRQ